MGRKLKRGTVGNAAQYLTRTKAIRKLQLRLSEFRRLCILKGIHPREPKKKVKGANKTYYHVKDINWLMHEPLLQVFRNMKSHEAKVRKAYGKFNPDLAQRLRKLAPKYKLDHLVKERYPSFVDALRDLDDPLTMVHLFATLPAEKRCGIPTKAVETAKRLALEWNAWTVRCHALRKVFVSVKGIYFQAEVLGQAVTWLVPHQLAQVLPTDVDYKVMLTFLEFYECLLQFVNFKLYHTLQLKYPPVLDDKLEAAAAGLAAVMRELAGVAVVAGAQTEEQSQALQALASSAQARRSKQLDANGAGLGVPQANGTGLATKIQQIAAAEGGAPNTEGEDEAVLDIDAGGSDAEEDSEADSEAGDDDDDDDDDDDEEEEEEEDDGKVGSDDMDAEGLADRQRSHAGTSTSAAGPAGGDPAGAWRSPASASLYADQAEGGEEDDGPAGLRAAGGALGEGVAADDDAAVCATLFKGLVVFLAREVPREPLALVIRAFGGVAAWDGEGSPYEHTSDAITHQVVDRPTQGHRFLARHYVQPQWVFDSANFRVLMPLALYTPGKVPPPHLSPFVNNDEEGYTPDWALEVKRLQEAARDARMRASGLLPASGFVGETDDANMADASAGTAASGLMLGGAGGLSVQAARELEAAEAAERAHAADLARELQAAQQQGEAGGDASLEGEDVDEDDEQEDGAAGAARKGAAGGKPVAVGGKRSAAQVAAEAARDEAAQKDIMMTRKNRKLYERINRAVDGKRARTEALQDKKKTLTKQGVVGAAGQLLAKPASKAAKAKPSAAKPAGSKGRK